MERKRIKEGAIALAIILALTILVWWMLKDSAQEQTPPQEEAQILPSTTTKNRATATVDPEEIPKVREVSAGAVARTFVERIGSYSSESNYQNVDDVLGVVTSSLAKKLQVDAERARTQAPNEEGGYYGISTVYVGAKTLQESEEKRVMLVQTQREESFGSPENAQVRYQEIEVTLVQEEGVWKVATYAWKE